MPFVTMTHPATRISPNLPHANANANANASADAQCPGSEGLRKTESEFPGYRSPANYNQYNLCRADRLVTYGTFKMYRTQGPLDPCIPGQGVRMEAKTENKFGIDEA
ncbi:unnamed protein product [Tuber aestivum]|uniref:Uncharacterized protein n=1 Tax=Tuber aestivum TaxID=59557 RepID=A0A292PKB8_9PEZI|nr:unnamed protein product [Tuber aestivum]